MKSKTEVNVSEERVCPYDGKKLRSDNRSGVCGRCSANGRKLENAPKSPKTEAPPAKKSPAPKRPDLTVCDVQEKVDRFLQATGLLGMRGDALLADFIDGWLVQVREKAQSLVEEA